MNKLAVVTSVIRLGTKPTFQEPPSPAMSSVTHSHVECIGHPQSRYPDWERP